jgi:putative tricarboxylic transport membrane protein
MLAASAGAAAQGADIRIVAPSAPGSGWDHIAQTLRAALSEQTGLAAAVTNVPGRGGVSGLTQFLASPEENDLIVTGLTMLDATLLTRNFPAFDRLTPIARLSLDRYAVIVPASSPIKSARELRVALLIDPGKLAWAGGPIGGVDHVATILLAHALGVEAKRINYVAFLTSAEARVAAAEERVTAALLPLSELPPDLEGGRIRILGVSSPERLPGLDAPTLAEMGVPLDFANWRGVAARPGLRAEEQSKLETMVRRATGTQGWRDTLTQRRWEEGYLPPAEFQAFVRQEHHRIRDALKAAGLLKHDSE